MMITTGKNHCQYLLENLNHSIREEIMQHNKVQRQGHSEDSNDYIEYEKIGAMYDTIFI